MSAVATPDALSSRHRSRHHHHHHHREEKQEEGHHGSTSSSSLTAPTLPAYEPLSAPLTPQAQRALASLSQSSSFRNLRAHVKLAAEKLTETAGETNERATDARIRYERQKQDDNNDRRRSVKNEGEGDGNNEDEADSEVGNDKVSENEEDDDENNQQAAKLARLEEKVKEVTGRLEEHMRQMVDAGVKLDKLSEVVENLGKEAEATGGVAPGRRRDTGAAGRWTRRTRQRGEDEDEEMIDVDEDDECYEAPSERRNRRPDQPPSQKLQEKLAENEAQWQRKSLTERYSGNNEYIGFYRMVHEAKHPGNDIPPVPHPSTWFAHLEDTNSTANPSSSAAAGITTSSHPRHTRRQAAPPADSDEIAIEHERISLRCPVTLLPFTDPVTSTKCPHSFEREAIEAMINRSSMTVPAEPDPRGGGGARGGGGGGARPRRVRCVECPVCTVKLTLNDLKPDPVLLRRVRRAQEAQQREAEEEEFDRAAGRRRHTKGGRYSGITVASYDGEDAEDDEVAIEREETVRVKREQSVAVYGSR